MKGVDGMGKIPRDSWAIIERVIRRYPESKKEYEDIYYGEKAQRMIVEHMIKM